MERNVYLLYGVPADSVWGEVLIAIYGDLETAEYERERFKADKNWSSLEIQSWQVKQRERFNWEPVPTPYF